MTAFSTGADFRLRPRPSRMHPWADDTGQTGAPRASVASESKEADVAKTLVIVESPAKAKTIEGFLGRGEYQVLASRGHIRDLPSSAKQVPKSVTDPEIRRLGIDVNNHFEPVYVVVDKKRDVVKELRAALKGADEVLLATDEDREGEAISWHVLEVLRPSVPVKRLVFHEITASAIAEALANPRALDMRLVEAQEGRRKLDRLFGYEMSVVTRRRASYPFGGHQHEWPWTRRGHAEPTRESLSSADLAAHDEPPFADRGCDSLCATRRGCPPHGNG